MENDPVNLVDPLGLDWFDCWAKCIEENRWDWGWITGYTLANPLMNWRAGGTGRSGVGGPAHATSWQHKFGGAISKTSGTPWFGRAGRFLGRASLGLTIFEGFYDIGAIGRCAVVCSGKKPDCPKP